MTLADAIAHAHKNNLPPPKVKGGPPPSLKTVAGRTQLTASVPQTPISTTAAPRRGKQPNKTEAEFARLLMARGAIEPIFEAVKLRIGENCYYAPDWMIASPNGEVTFYEVKGPYIWDDSKVKFKAAKDKYPYWNFEMWQRTKEKGWTQIL